MTTVYQRLTLAMFQRNPRTRKVVKYGKRDRHPLPLNASHFQPQVESAFNSHTHGHGVDVKWPAFADSSSASEESDSPKTPTTPQEPLRCDPQSVSSKKAKDIGRSARDWGTTFSQPNGVAHALSEICFGQNSHDRLSEGVQQAPKNDLVELWGDQVPKRPEEAALPESPAPRTRPRRHAASLPVGELVLVPSHQIEKQCASPVSDSNEISAEDSIHSQASTAIGSHADFKINSKDDMLSQRPPATSAHAYRPLAKKLVDKTSSQLRRRPSSSPRSLGKLRGDGFHASELHIGVAHNTLKRCSKPSGSLTSVFRQLELTRGPLPTVDFGDSTSKIDLAVASTRADDKRPQARIDRIGADREAARSNTSRRSTSPRIRAQNELVMAQLSSISAPARQWSLSDDSDDEDEDSVGATSRMEWAIDPEHEQSQSEDVLMDNVEDDGEDGQKVDWAGDQEYQQSQSEDLLMDNVEDGEEDGQPSTKTSACATSSKSYASLDAEGADTHVRGVTFDFRQHAPGKTPVALRGRRLVEVNDAIIEDPDMHLEAGFHPDEPASSTNTLPTWSSLADEPTCRLLAQFPQAHDVR